MEPNTARGGRECGQTLVLFVLMLSVLLGFVAMSVDVGSILYRRSDLQKTADAAALAGAQELPNSAVLAQSKAQEWAVANGIDLAAGDEIDVNVSDDQTSVTVTVTHETPFIFARVLGFDTVDVNASATARVGAPASLAGVIPFGVLEDEINQDGTPTVLKFDSNNPQNGNFGALRIDGPGSKIHEKSIMYGSENGICGLSQPTCANPILNTQTGNIISATRDGFNYRFDNTSSSCDEFDEVLVSNGNGGYRVKGSCNPFNGSSNSMRLVLIPVIDEFPNGNGPVTVQKFLAAFLLTLDNNKCTGNSCEMTVTFAKVVVDPTNDAELGIYDPDSGIKFIRLVA